MAFKLPSWLQTLNTDIEAGFAVAAPIIGAFDPPIEPLIAQIAAIFGGVVNDLAGNPAAASTLLGIQTVGSVLPPATQSALVKSLATSHAIASKVAAQPPPFPPTAVLSKPAA